MGRGYYRKILAAGLFGLSITDATVRGQGPVNFAPGGRMIQPTNGALVRSIGQMTLRAQMSDRDGFVTSVRFYSGANLLGVGNPSGSNEFFMTWTPGRTGNFSLYASAVDNSGATGSTEMVQISIATNPPAFSAIELETPGTNSAFDPWAINNHGVIVGSINSAAAQWNHWRCETFDVFGKPAVARAISDDGTIVGDFVQEHGQQFDPYQPFCYFPSRGATQLPALAYGFARAVSRAGIVGTARTNSFATSLFGYRYDGLDYAFFDGGGLNCDARDINDEGVIVGTVLIAQNETRPFIFRGGEMTLLDGGAASGANAINRHAQVVGYDGSEAFLYENGAIAHMGTLGTQHYALDINDYGAVVGAYYPHGSVNSPSAFLFHDGVMIDLNLLIPTNSGWALQTARSINNSNWIVGTGTRAGDGTAPTTRGFLLVPGPIIRVLRATTSVVEGKAYFANGPAVFERSADLIAWVPVSTNDTGAAEAAFSLAVDPSLGAAFYRVVQPSAP